MEPIGSLAVLTTFGVVGLFVVAAITAGPDGELRDWLRLHLAELALPSRERRLGRAGRLAICELDRDLAVAALGRLRREIELAPRPGHVGYVDGLAGPRLHVAIDRAELECHLYRSLAGAELVPGAVLVEELSYSEPFGWRIVLRDAGRVSTFVAWRVHFVRPISRVG